jgi:hypothetical protein
MDLAVLMAGRPTEERLGMLAAKVAELEAPASGGSPHTLKPCDVAASLAGLPRGPYLFALAKYAGDETVLAELTAHVYRTVLDLAHKEGWQTKHRKGLRRLSELALIEAEIVPQRCGQCKGRQWVIRSSLRVPCEACEGTGNYTRSARARARYLEVDHKGFIHTWSRRLAIVTGTLRQWEIDVMEKLWRELK